MKNAILITSTCLFTAISGMAAEGFSLSEQPGESITVAFDGKPIVQLVTRNDKTSEQSAKDTDKVFLHVMDPLDASGKKTITKGAGAKYPHHRGIFIGWSKTRVGEEIFNTWGMNNGVRQVYDRILNKEMTDDAAQFSVAIQWQNGDDLFLSEERSFTVHKPAADGAFLLDVDSRITAVKADTDLNGDPEHAGCQFRAAAEVVDNKSPKYLFPSGAMNDKQVKEARDMPWAAMTYKVGGRDYHVQHMSHPSLPKPVRYSAYRDYGRFGSFFVTTIKKGESKDFRVRFYISPGAYPDSMIEDSNNRYAKYAAE